MATEEVLTYTPRFWPKNTNLNEIHIDFLTEFPVEKDPLNGVTFHGLYIPEEIMVNIFCHLCPSDILNCSLVCKNWFNIAKSNTLWHTIYNRKEHPKKVKNLPWYVFYCYFTTDNFKNLVRNGNGEERFNHWEIVLDGGDKFIIQEPSGCDPLPLDISEFHGHTTCFATSYRTCFKYQKIDLKPKRLLRHIIRKYKPVLYASEWYTGRFDCGCIYELKIVCDRKGEETNWNQSMIRRPHHIARRGPRRLLVASPHSKTVQGKIEQWSNPPWEKLEIFYEDYPEDIESVYFCHMGRDKQFWAGHYGSKMAGGVLKFLFDSIKPAQENMDDLNEIVST